jgi:hypothetical protein
MIYAIMIAASDIHPDAKFKTNCIICQLVHNLSCGKKAAPLLLPTPQHYQMTYIIEYAIPLYDFPTSSVNSRGPPLFITYLKG